MYKLREKLALYNLETPPKLAKALGTSRQWAYQILHGQLSFKTAEKIAAIIDEPPFVVYGWGHNKDGKAIPRERRTPMSK